MTEWIVSSSVLIVVVALVRQLFKGRLSLRLQYALWALVLVRLLLPVSFGQSKLSVLNAVEERQTAQITVDIPPSRVDYVPPDLAPVEPDPELPTEEQHRQNQQQWQNQMDAAWEQYKAENTKEVTISVPEILRIVWYAGMAAMALCLLWSNLSFRLRLRRSRRPLEEADCPMPVYVTGAVETPCLFGLPRPAVYVTPEVAGDELAMGHVLAHEYTHYRHGDHIWSLLRCLCLVLHWYNPLVWLAASLSRRDGELACDEGTLRRIGEGERLAYGRTLIGLTCARRGGLLRTATTMTGGKRSIRERITLIAKKPKMAAYTLIAVLLIAAVAAGCTFTGAKKAPAEWTAMLTEETVSGVTIYGRSGEVVCRLDKERCTELLTVIHGITEERCRPLEEGDMAEEGQPSVTVYQGLNLWSFRCRGDGLVRLEPSHISSDPGYEVGVDRMVIDCPELYQFIVDCAAAHGGSDTPADPGDGPTDPGHALAELGEGGDPLFLTLYTAGHGAWQTLTVSCDRISEIFSGRTSTALERPATAPSDYWLTVTNAGNRKTLTVWSGEEGLVQYSDESGSKYWTMDSGEDCAILLRRLYDGLAPSPDQVVFYARDAEMAADLYPSRYCQMLTELPTDHPNRITDYEVLDWGITETSADGNAVLGWMEYAVQPKFDPENFMAGAAEPGTGWYEGWVLNHIQFVLELEENGLWHCTAWGGGIISLEHYGYEVAPLVWHENQGVWYKPGTNGDGSVIINGYNGYLEYTLRSEGKWLYFAAGPELLGPAFDGSAARCAEGSAWLEGNMLHINFIRADIPAGAVSGAKASFTVDVERGVVVDAGFTPCEGYEISLTEEEMVDIGMTFAQIIQGAEAYLTGSNG